MPRPSLAARAPTVAAYTSVTGQAGDAASRPTREIDARSQADRQISMDEAVDLAQRRYKARVVRAEVSERGGRRVYLLRLLSEDGRVFNVRVDAATGSIQ
jgi:uncharacterized membrane protein YkoI